jgi:hypothetical protein
MGNRLLETGLSVGLAGLVLGMHNRLKRPAPLRVAYSEAPT